MATKLKNRALGVIAGGIAGRRHSYNMVTDDKIAKMMKITYQQRTEAKIKWAVKTTTIGVR